MNDLFLQRCPHRYEYQRNGTAQRWSDTLKRWLVFDPVLVSEALRNDAFGVAVHDVSLLEDRFGVDLSLSKRVNETLPLTIEGAAHKSRRMTMAQAIAQNSDAGFSAFRDSFDCRLCGLMQDAAPNPFCLIEALFRPAFRDAIAALAGLQTVDTDGVENLPLHFCAGISLRNRLEIEAIYGRIAAQNGIDPACPVTAQKLGMVLLSINTLMGSVAASVIVKIGRNAGRSLTQIPWGAEIPVTALPVIERIALRDATLGETAIAAGMRLRLFVETAGISDANDHIGSTLYFAAGAHKCLGIAFSRRVWHYVTQQLGAIDQIWTLGETRLREHDSIFNLYEMAKVERYG